jgi:hypothetical protein
MLKDVFERRIQEYRCPYCGVERENLAEIHQVTGGKLGRDEQAAGKHGLRESTSPRGYKGSDLPSTQEVTDCTIIRAPCTIFCASASFPSLMPLSLSKMHFLRPFSAGILGDLQSHLKVTLRWHGYCSKFIMGRNQKFKMDRHLPEVQNTASDTAEIINVAIKCTAFVLRRAQELPQDKQKPMLAIVKDLISMEADKKGLST